MGNLLSSNSFELVTCAVASAAMDLDVLISRSSLKYHRAFTHSILFAFILSTSLASLSLVFDQPFLKIFLLALLGSHLHLFLDLSTTWPIPLFFPASRQSTLELDTAVNPLLLLSSLLWLILIAISNQALFFPPVLSLIVISLLALYLLARYAIKRIAASRTGDLEGEIALLPTFSPFAWKVLQRWRNESNQSFTQKNSLIHILWPSYVEINTRTFPYSPEEIGRLKASPPLETERAAILFSTSIEQIAAFISKFRYANARASLENEIWRVIWSAEETGLGIEVLLRAKTGEVNGVKMRSAWERS